MTKLSALLLTLLLLLSTLLSCSAEKHSLLYEKTVGKYCYAVRGSGTHARQITVKKDGSLVWSMEVDVSRAVGNLHSVYGFYVEDLNFDGIADLRIATDLDGESATYLCFLGQPNGRSFTRSEELSGLCNIRADAKLGAIFAFSHSFTTELSHHTECDKTTKYVWDEGKLRPDMYASITYYSEANLYCYSVAYYNTDSNAFDSPNDRWLTPEEYKEIDMSFLYYFR